MAYILSLGRALDSKELPCIVVSPIYRHFFKFLFLFFELAASFW